MSRLKPALFAGFLLGAACALLLAFVATRIVDQPAQSSSADRGRWMNVTYPAFVEVAAESGNTQIPVFGEATDPSHMNLVYIGATSTPGKPGVYVDGATGDVLREYVYPGRPSGAAVVGLIKDGLAYEPFDAAKAPWPYRDDAQYSGAHPREPEPLSGIQMRVLRNGGSGVRYENWRSFVDVWEVKTAPDGSAFPAGSYSCEVQVADRNAFARLVEELRQAGAASVPIPADEGRPPCDLQS